MTEYKFKFSILSLPWLLMFLVSCVYATITPRLGVVERTPTKNLNAKLARASKGRLKTFYYAQTLDHFNYRPDSYTTFQQRYMMNSKHWAGANTSSPILVYFGAEAPIDNDVENVGFLNSYAPELNALIVFIEHRYYGKSMPFGSFEEAYSNTSTLGYFNSAQALADYAEVLVSLKKNLSAESSPVIVIGGSYGGMLASWFRLKYPHIGLGALASSAPILYFEGLTPHEQYYLIATKDYKEASMNCYNTIRQSWSKIDKIASKSDGLSLLSQKFKICNPINASSELKDQLERMYTSAAQYDKPPIYPVKMICDAIDVASKRTTDILSRILAGVVAFKGNKKCYDLNQIITEADLGWRWQTCTDLVIPMGREHDNTMFPISPFILKDLTESCQAVFGVDVTPRPHWIVTEFGGHGIKNVLKKFGSNIIFSNGLRDPYSGGGVLQNISNSVVAILTTNGSHTLDLLTPSKDDPKWLVGMRASEISIVKGWIAEYYAMLRS
ncbi:hypothetical protein IFM89_017095 [Coptis chinensis]|uniref:Lysosomal Pro-X carboxypeptidase n=1 Tax=Coptis chinensis TaxID=261450 RepID=A0A835LRY7_9MAGN|nr:hypothetical protein IFM89_017095 [Coptis chinensis]